MSSQNRIQMCISCHRLASLFTWPRNRNQHERHAPSVRALSDLSLSSDENNGNPYPKEQSHTNRIAASHMPSLFPARPNVTIHELPDHILLTIFDYCRGNNEHFAPRTWNPLVHVCQRWRHIFFASPRRLQLLLVCDVKTPVREITDIWPLLPIIIRYSPNEEEGEGNVIAALNHRSRVSWIVFKALANHVLERFTAVMQEPFPALTGLHLQSFGKISAVIPDTFLGGSTPQLKSFFLEGIGFPAFPRFAVSATHLTKIRLQKIPDTGYISPQAITSCISKLPELEELVLGFLSPHSCPSQTTEPPSTRDILPSLTYFEFRGVREYLEDLVSRINTPQLRRLDVWFFMDLDFVVPQLKHFIGGVNRLKLHKRAYVELYPWSANIAIGLPAALHLKFKCDRLDWRISLVAELCRELSPVLSEVERLEINGDPDLLQEPQVDMGSLQWLELFRPFPSVQGLYISKKLGPHIAHVFPLLTGPEENVTEVLPLLRVLSFGGLKPYGIIRRVIEPFVSARQLSGDSIAVTHWDQDPHCDPADDDYAVSDGLAAEDSRQVTQGEQEGEAWGT